MDKSANKKAAAALVDKDIAATGKAIRKERNSSREQMGKAAHPSPIIPYTSHTMVLPDNKCMICGREVGAAGVGELRTTYVGTYFYIAFHRREASRTAKAMEIWYAWSTS